MGSAAEVEAALGAPGDAFGREGRQAGRALGLLGVEVDDGVADRQALAARLGVEVSLVDLHGALPFVARDREPGVGASTAGQRPGRRADPGVGQLLRDLAHRRRLALEGDVHAGRDVHPGSLTGSLPGVAAQCVRRALGLSRQRRQRRQQRAFGVSRRAVAVHDQQQVRVQLHVQHAPLGLLGRVRVGQLEHERARPGAGRRRMPRRVDARWLLL